MSSRLGSTAAFLWLLVMVAAPAIAAAQEGAAAPAPAAAPAADEYVLGIEDKLSISVWKEADLSKTVVVRPDGKITFPLVGDIQAAGHTARQITDEVTRALTRFIKEPVVTVVVEEINSFKVFVIGEVATQGALNLRRRTRLLEAIAQAGGLTTYADKSNVVLLRNEDGKETRTRIDYRKVLSGEKPELNVFLKPGDTILAN